MEGNELLNIFLALAGAAVLGLVGMVAFGWFIDMQRRLHHWSMALVYPIILIAMAAGSVLSQRRVTASEVEAITSSLDTGLITWFFRLTTATIVCICLARFASVSQRHEAQGKEGRALFFAFVFFYLGNIVLNNIFGEKPAFYERFLPALIIFTAVYFSRSQDRYYSLEATKWGLLLFIAGSCAAALALPSVTVQENYDGFIPGMSIRFWGLASNPNAMGPLSVVFLLLIAHSPFRSRLLQIASIAMGLATLILPQSKTAWIAAMVAFGLWWWHRSVKVPAAMRKSAKAPPSWHNFAGPILFGMAGLAVIAGIAIVNAFDSQFATLNNERQLTSLTGRTEIWEIAINAWKANPLFGYGSSIWGDEFRQSIGNNAAVSAHSQFMQALSEGGAIGLLALLLYFFMLWRCAYTANDATGGLSLALFSIILIRSITETPLDVTNIFSGEFVVHLLLFRLALVRVPSWEYARIRQLQWS